MINVSVIGATGYTGAELVKILVPMKDVVIHSLTSDNHAGKPISEIVPSLKGVCDVTLVKADVEAIADSCDAVFLCLPHGTGMETVCEFYRRKIKVFDLSADFRIQDATLFEKTYKIPHKHPELLNKTAYGLSELYTEEIEKMPIVAVPGCYPTSALIPLLPLLKNSLIETDNIIIDSKSGVSGAGKKSTENTHFCEVNESLKPYAIFEHRHKHEIDYIINRFTKIKTDVVFTPHLLPVTRGMLSTIYVRSSGDVSSLRQAWLNTYGKTGGAVRLVDGVPSIGAVSHTPFIDIALFKNGDNVIILSALDNLLKGASSQAVQCFQIWAKNGARS
jgi:N-acetyl-gamma-glutamyl-phosphate reductase